MKILDLARNMIRLAGHSVREESDPGGDIEIAITGLRPGEKLHEKLLIAGGNAEGTLHHRIMKAEEPCLDAEVLSRHLERLSEAISTRNEAAVRKVLSEVAGRQ